MRKSNVGVGGASPVSVDSGSATKWFPCLRDSRTAVSASSARNPTDTVRYDSLGDHGRDYLLSQYATFTRNVFSGWRSNRLR